MFCIFCLESKALPAFTANPYGQNKAGSFCIDCAAQLPPDIRKRQKVLDARAQQMFLALKDVVAFQDMAALRVAEGLTRSEAQELSEIGTAITTNARQLVRIPYEFHQTLIRLHLDNGD